MKSVNYNYKLDYKLANITEQEVAQLICRRFPKTKLISRNNDNRYDLLFDREGKEIKVEVKEDFTCQRTGNIGLEFSCRGKDSGISVSQADFYVYKVHTPERDVKFLMIPVSVLKRLIKEQRFKRIVNGGDIGSDSLNYLFDYYLIKNNSFEI